MSLFYMNHGHREVKEYNDGLTKQSFKDETDVNRILAKYQVSGVISHMAKFEAQYGDFADFDFQDTQNMLNRGLDMFAALPSEVRREFEQDPDKFFDFVNDPKNNERVNELLPGIANPGDYFVDVSSKTPPGELIDGGEPGGKFPLKASDFDGSGELKEDTSGGRRSTDEKS